MTEKRYKAIPETGEYKDTVTGEFLSPKFEEGFYKILDLLNENEELKQLIKKLEKEMHLMHMSSMFSTVKSFNGDVSKRYKYSEETNTIYDTANKYGQYYQILDKKEVVMLLNEYETLLEGDDNDCNSTS